MEPGAQEALNLSVEHSSGQKGVKGLWHYLKECENEQGRKEGRVTRLRWMRDGIETLELNRQ
jgi:hypothetical protein